ncbi:hypothetical protein BHE74_00014459 [Ensete ventricosum]|nr:hypothetical protein BHE74_00014459 [Ensete ventricosum]RZR86949.1 hypothetical protein BHM03_00014244 [Ensete ventricosum]
MSPCLCLLPHHQIRSAIKEGSKTADTAAVNRTKKGNLEQDSLKAGDSRMKARCSCGSNTRSQVTHRIEMRVTRRHICHRHLPPSHTAKRNTRKAQKRAQPKLHDVKRFALIGDHTNYYQCCCSYFFRGLGEVCGGTVNNLVELDAVELSYCQVTTVAGGTSTDAIINFQASMTAICCLILLKAGGLWRREVSV